jgi:hypothetical protein
MSTYTLARPPSLPQAIGAYNIDISDGGASDITLNTFSGPIQNYDCLYIDGNITGSSPTLWLPDMGPCLIPIFTTALNITSGGSLKCGLTGSGVSRTLVSTTTKATLHFVQTLGNGQIAGTWEA